MTATLPAPPERCCSWLTRYWHVQPMRGERRTILTHYGRENGPDVDRLIEADGGAHLECADCGKWYAVPEGWPR